MTRRACVLIATVCGVCGMMGLWFIVRSLNGSRELAGISPAKAFSALVLIFVVATMIWWRYLSGRQTTRNWWYHE